MTPEQQKARDETVASFTTYEQAQQYQLDEWVAGRPWHNTRSPNSDEICDEGECCPDFSCCVPELMWDEQKREIFASGNQIIREEMLINGLTNLLKSDQMTITISDDKEH